MPLLQFRKDRLTAGGSPADGGAQAGAPQFARGKTTYLNRPVDPSSSKKFEQRLSIFISVRKAAIRLQSSGP